MELKIRKCIVMGLDEFESIIGKIFNCEVETNCGCIEIIDYRGRDKTFFTKLSKYLGHKVVSVHNNAVSFNDYDDLIYMEIEE